MIPLIKSIKKNWRLLGACTFFFLSLVVLAYMVVTIPFPAPSTNPRKLIISNTVKVVVLPMLEIQVSPPGFPEIGQTWKISVYLINKTDNEKLVYEPAPNSIVTVTVPFEKGQKIYELNTDENGEAYFQFISEYKGIAFQANYLDDLSSPEIVLSAYFVPSDLVDTLLYYNVFSVVGSLASGFLVRSDNTTRHKIWKRLSKILLFCCIALFSFVTLFSLYSKTFEGTTWGYPDKIANTFVDFTLLRYMFYIAILLFISAWILQLIVGGLIKEKE